MYNKVTMIGRLTADPDHRHTPNGVSVTSFRIAVYRKYVRKGAKRTADYFNVVCWRDDADFVNEHFSKGKMILVEGEMQTEQYTDRNGNPATRYEILAERVSFVTEKTHDESDDGGNRTLFLNKNA